MTVIEDLTRRNADFATHRFIPGLRINPSRRTMIIGCVDPRVDPGVVLGVELGEAAIIRNVGGRVTPALFKTMAMLGRVGKANGGGPGGDWNLVVLHHTDCGMTDLAAFPDLLAEYFEIPADRLPDKAVSNPYASVKVDAALLAAPGSPAHGWQVSGLVYDVETGLVQVVATDV
ncbi:carbonic anhydrase [Micromonospora sp. ATA51]|uniref:carbonic anhydrase n=1 Tax=Micromonospora sp. ATA51 TaxID=2806098 RepID=UPI001A4892E2|nr:carbonic anhydrase [Micromonospora sp. ATA51]MBM0225501.1 carbonic anhydrase [Micromonospora sp. ATA51]